MTDRADIREDLRRRRSWTVATGAAGLAASCVLLFMNTQGFFQGYLFAFTYWVGVSLGHLAVLMLHHLVAGEWGLVTQRILEAGASTLGMMAVFFIPILLGMHELYEWTHDDVVAESPLLQHKQPYLNVPFFIVRSVIYFAAWITLSVLLVRWSDRQDETRDGDYARRMRRLSAGGLVAHVLLMTFASVDWIMSIEPHWFSTIYGWMVEASQTLVAIALVVLTLAAVRSAPALRPVVRTKHHHDYGNLMLAFVILWAYMMFSQYLIMWSGNVPENVQWYVHRQEGLWFWVGPFLILFHFAVPFALLLFRRTKRSVRLLSALAIALLCVHAVFVAWLILPGFRVTGWVTFAAAFTAFVGIGGCWASLFMTRLAARRLLPLYDPRFEDLLQQSREAAS